MKSLFLTKYHNIDWIVAARFKNCKTGILLNNGFSFFQHRFNNVTNLFYNSDETELSRIQQEAEKYDVIYASFLLQKDFEFLKPIITKNWVIGGPSIEYPDYPIDTVAQVCSTPYEFYVGESELSDHFTPYWYEFFDARNDIEVARASLPIGIGCYWKKCIFCDFCQNDNGSVLVRKDLQNIFSKLEKKPYRQWYHLSFDSTQAHQLNDIAKALPTLYEKDISLQAFVRLDNANVNTLEKYDDLRGLEAVIGMEILSQQGSDIIKKGFIVDNIKRICDLSHRGLSIQINLIHNWNFFNKDMYDESMYYLDEIKKRSTLVHDSQYVVFKHEEICNWHKHRDMAITLQKLYGGTLEENGSVYESKIKGLRYKKFVYINPVGENKYYCEQFAKAVKRKICE